MQTWLIALAIIILIAAIVMYQMMPVIIDYEMSFIWIILGFLVVYVIAAFVLSHYIHGLSFMRPGQSPTEEVYSPDVVPTDAQ